MLTSFTGLNSLSDDEGDDSESEKPEFMQRYWKDGRDGEADHDGEECIDTVEALMDQHADHEEACVSRDRPSHASTEMTSSEQAVDPDQYLREVQESVRANEESELFVQSGEGDKGSRVYAHVVPHSRSTLRTSSTISCAPLTLLRTTTRGSSGCASRMG